MLAYEEEVVVLLVQSTVKGNECLPLLICQLCLGFNLLGVYLGTFILHPDEACVNSLYLFDELRLRNGLRVRLWKCG